jgi:bud site selection protein 20
MGRIRRKGNVAKNKSLYRAKRTRNYKRDLDQIVYEDLVPAVSEKLLHQPVQEEMPGLGQHYCVTCARYFISDQAIQVHFRTKEHKKRFKVVKNEVPYSIEEAEKAGGLRAAANAPKKVRPEPTDQIKSGRQAL